MAKWIIGICGFLFICLILTLAIRYDAAFKLDCEAIGGSVLHLYRDTLCIGGDGRIVNLR